ncbi:unnamed protein product [Phaeothamnion confervicola]
MTAISTRPSSGGHGGRKPAVATVRNNLETTVMAARRWWRARANGSNSVGQSGDPCDGGAARGGHRRGCVFAGYARGTGGWNRGNGRESWLGTMGCGVPQLRTPAAHWREERRRKLRSRELKEAEKGFEKPSFQLAKGAESGRTGRGGC